MQQRKQEATLHENEANEVPYVRELFSAKDLKERLLFTSMQICVVSEASPQIDMQVRSRLSRAVESKVVHKGLRKNDGQDCCLCRLR